MTVGELELSPGLDRRAAQLRGEPATKRGASPRGGRRRLIRSTLAVADLAGLTLAFVIAELLFGSHGRFDAIRENLEPVLFVASLPLWIVGAHVYGLYSGDEQRTDHTTTDDLKGVLHLITVGTWVFFGATSLTGIAAPDLHKLATFWLLAIMLVTAGRITGRAYARRRPAYIQNALIVGIDEAAHIVAAKIERHPEYKVELVGFVGSARASTNGYPPVLGDASELPELIAEHRIHRVIFAAAESSRETMIQLVRELHERDVQVDLVPPLYEVVGPTLTAHAVEGLALLGLPALRLTHWSNALKRGVDVLGAMLLLVLLAPFFAVTALWIKLDSGGGPIFFSQERVGLADRRFRIHKFRTMQTDADERKAELAHLNHHHLRNGDGRMFKIDGDPRVTRPGRFLRRHFLDELPQLVNVMRGEMSLVGPRPLIPEEDALVGEWGRKRLRLKPGMTGVWQVLGRNDISFDEMIKLDYIYVTNWSLANDLRLLAQTAALVAQGAGGDY